MTKPSRRQVLGAATAMPLAGMLAGCQRPGQVQSRSLKHRLEDAGAFLDDLVQGGDLPGAAMRVSLNGEVLLTRYSGKADIGLDRDIGAETLYRAYSMSKPVTAAAIMVLVDDGRISLDDSVSKYVPEFASLSALVASDGEVMEGEPAKGMKIVHLLTHTSGLANSWTPGPLAASYQRAELVSASYPHNPAFADGLPEIARRLAAIHLQFQPGTEWLYSISTDIAGLIVERVSGQTFGSFLTAQIFDPLGMADTGFYVPASKKDRLASVYSKKDGALVLQEAADRSPFLVPPLVESGSAGLVTSLEDYGRFAAMLAGGGETWGVRVLSRSAAQAMTSSQVDADVLGTRFDRFMGFATGGSGKGMGMGLGGAVLVDPSASAIPGQLGEYTWGGAASTTFFAVPGTGIEATLMTQLFPSGSLPLRDMLKTSVYRALT